MTESDQYELYIDALNPDTVPMVRLAEYMENFAKLLGQTEHVHFVTLHSGSLTLAVKVEPQAIPKIEKQVEELARGGGSVAARKALQQLDDLLCEDNAVGSVRHGKQNLIEFPGRTRHVETVLGPITQLGTLDGELIHVGGRDETVNIHLKNGEKTHQCITSKEIARSIARHIFGSPIRVIGEGTWNRSESGTWSLKKFEIRNFELLDGTPLLDLFAALRAQLLPPDGGRTNPVELMRQLRGE